MDRLFSAMNKHPERKSELGGKLRDLVPMSGHPTGFFMANVIIDQLGKEILLTEIGNPFAFFRLYNIAAGKKGVPAFSEDAMAFIGSLEKRYIY
jgi:hypothetical protein